MGILEKTIENQVVATPSKTQNGVPPVADSTINSTILTIDDVTNYQSPLYTNGKSQNGASDEAPEEDPFRYGWRMVERIADDGTETYDQIPLTLEDLLHPQEGDHRVQNIGHSKYGFYFHAAARRQIERPPGLVTFDVRMDWRVPGVKPLGPDIAVIKNAHVTGEIKGTYVVGVDGDAPEMVMEITSPETRKQDFGTKLELMRQVRLPYYFIVDLVANPENRRIYGYELVNEGKSAHYVPIEPNEQGWVWMEPIQLWLALEDGDVFCYDTDGNLALDHDEALRQMEAEKARADAEQQRADAEQQRADEAEHHSQVEKQRADAEQQRADEAERHSQVEKQRADELAEQNRRLLDRLAALGIDPESL
ncbi:MAG: Uma2 family endonuclease [Chloroflexota bacterium]